MARALLRRILTHALAALDPERLIAGAVRLGPAGRTLVLEGIRGPVVRLPLAGGLLVVGAGKGAAGLAAAVEDRLGAAVRGGLVVVPRGHARRLRRVEIAFGGHPVPDRTSLGATRRLLRLLDREPEGAVLVLLTGGASSLLAAPAPGLSLADERHTTTLLLASGASIQEMNTVRKHLSAIKGGRLGERLAGRPAAALVVSDVPGDDLAVIASGPTVADPTTFAAAAAIVRRYGLAGKLRRPVRDHLARGLRGRAAETPKPGAPALRRLRTLLLAGNASARAGAAIAARRQGLAVHVASRPLVGSTREAARRFARLLRRVQAGCAPRRATLLIAGGETTVALGRRPGRGGRNQEFALAVASELAGRPGWTLLSAGTDGVDGPTDAAGGYADGRTAARAGDALGRALARHDAYPLLDALGDLLITGPTGTNVADLKLALVWKNRRWRARRGVIQAGP